MKGMSMKGKHTRSIQDSTSFGIEGEEKWKILNMSSFHLLLLTKRIILRIHAIYYTQFHNLLAYEIVIS